MLHATLEEAEEFCGRFRRALSDMNPCSLFRAELLLREALANAILHGSQGDPQKLVRCVVRRARGRVVISVEDQGGGFNWRAAAKRPKQPLETCGRGMELFQTYASRVRFNAKGNAVTLVMRLAQEGISKTK